MPHHKEHEKLEQIKTAILKHDKLSEEEKRNAIAHVEEWYAEDKGFGTLIETLTQKFATLEPIFAEMGLI